MSVIRKMQIKPINYHFTHIGMVKIKKSLVVSRVDHDVEQLRSVLQPWQEYKMVQLLWKTIQQVLLNMFTL